MEIYVHIPFCVRKCLYCDFLSLPASDTSKAEYVKKLCDEIKEGNHKDEKVTSIYIGGGTPSILDYRLIEKIMESIRETYNLSEDCEISMECNPGTLEYEKLYAYKRCGINRLSIGLQSSHNNELKELGRIHTYDDFLTNYNLAREVGFTNINVDLMSGLINQSFEKFVDTLNKVANLNPEHISVYSLIIEEGTPLYDYVKKMSEEGIDIRPSEDVDREIYRATKQILSSFGYERYEISNYAKPGYECKHNVGYWTGESYIGFGLGAASYFNYGDGAIRYNNTNSLKEYLDNIDNKTNIERLNKDDMMSEYMILGLRMCKGISKYDFNKLFNQTVENKYGEIIRKYSANEFISDYEDRIFLTEKGIDVSNYILCDFM